MRLLLVFLSLIITTAQAQTSILGKWKTIDDESNEEKSVVEIFNRDGKVHGKIVKLFRKPGEDPDPVCDECPADDSRYNKKIIGLEIIQNLVKSDEAYAEGTILDPEDGKIYRCKIWIEGSDLMVRGYWGPFFRTQTWKRVN